MFSTKQCAINWINDFSNGLQLEARKHGKYWVIYDADGFMLSEQRTGEIEDAKSSLSTAVARSAIQGS